MLAVIDNRPIFDIFNDTFYPDDGSKITFDSEFVSCFHDWLMDKWYELEDIIREKFPNGTDIDEYKEYLMNDYKKIAKRMGYIHTLNCDREV